MSTIQEATGQVIKRLSFGEMSSHQLLQGEGNAFQTGRLHGNDGGPQELENNENASRDVGRGPGESQASLQNRHMVFERALEEICLTSSRFNALEEAAKADYKEAGPGKLASLKDQFSKSKFEYVELETKEHFVRAIAEEGDRVLAGEEVKGSFLLEGVVGNQKAKVQDFKRLKEQTGQSINNIIDQIATEMGELEKEQEGVAMEVEACGSALESWEQMQETLAAATTEENKEDLEGLFSQQEAQLQNLIQQESSAREAGAHAQQEAEGAAEQIAELQARLQEAEAENLRLKEATEQVGRVSKSTETYEQMLELLHDLSGVRLTAATDSRLEFRVTTHVSSAEKTGRRKQAEVEHDLVVDLNSQTGGIEDARLNPSDVDIADIVDTVRGTRRLDFLVREIRQRMSCYALRASQVARTNRTTKYKMKTNKNDMIQVALPATGIMAFIDAPYDWPTPGVVLQLETLVTRSGGAAFQDDVLEKVVEQVNKSSAAQDGELVPFLQSIEVALQQFELV